MQSFQANDNVTLKYIDTGAFNSQEKEKPWLILIHGFTGSSSVWQRSLFTFSSNYRVIVPDLRGHGESDKPKHGYHVSRLAMDLKELMVHLEDSEKRVGLGWKAIGGSLGAAILWCYAELFTTKPFTHMIFVDQAPLQNSTLDGWDSRFCNRGMNSAMSLASLQTTLALSPETAHKGTINACLAYRAYPLATDTQTFEDMEADKEFFLGEAMKGDGEWYGKLMADHTSLDWRDSIRASFGTGSGSVTKVFVVTSSRSGCFPPAGPMKVVDLVGEKANGVVVDWGGHWCYWEDPRKFEELCLEFLEKEE